MSGSGLTKLQAASIEEARLTEQNFWWFFTGLHRVQEAGRAGLTPAGGGALASLMLLPRVRRMH